MRSEYVFAALKEVGNRFLLCRIAAASARRLHHGSTQPSQTINKSLKLIAADGKKAATPLPPAMIAPQAPQQPEPAAEPAVVSP